MRRALALSALVLALAATLPSVASAGSYTVWSCRDAAGDPLSTDAWVPFGNVANPASHSDTCASGGDLGLQMVDPADYAGGSVTGYAFTPPAGTTIAGYEIQMAGKTSSPPGGTHFEVGLTTGGAPNVAPGNGCSDDLDPCRFGDLSASWDAPVNRFAASALNTTGLAFTATCTAPTDCVTGSDSLPYPAFGRLYRSAVVVDDPTAPTISAIAGTVAAPGPVSGQRTVVVDASDVGGGVQRVELLVDGAVVDQLVGAGRCAPPYTAATPCPDATTSRFALDTTALANGPHSVSARAVDAAGNAVTSAPLAIDVANAATGGSVVVVPGPAVTVTVSGAPPGGSPSEQPVPPNPVSVTLRTASSTAKLPRGRVMRGTATGPDGKPVSGVRLAFDRRAFGAGPSAWKPVGTTATASDGTFRFPVVRESSQIRVRPAQTTVAGRGLVVSFVQPLRATLRSSARRLRNGDTVTLRARIDGGGGAWVGRDVLVQAVVRGAWRTVDTVRVVHRGRVSWSYRFAHTEQTAAYRFRLRLPAGPALPWKAVTTKPVTVLVKGG